MELFKILESSKSILLKQLVNEHHLPITTFSSFMRSAIATYFPQLGPTYYLPYQLYATQEQLKKASPEVS